VHKELLQELQNFALQQGGIPGSPVASRIHRFSASRSAASVAKRPENWVWFRGI
jgi:hypothetical protein